ncbi:MAG: ABC transporter permease [Propionibacteriaceae bacterium]|jgi:oligopeptide transport system permease protein|nr:ABC transporter permease [Propionibacteriaceae bacterium]
MSEIVTTTAAERPRSLGADAWDVMRRRPLFWVAAVLVVLFVAMAIAPELFTTKDPRSCDLAFSRQLPSAGAIFGYDFQGCDIFARTVYGARASILVGIFTALAAALLGGLLGTLAGYLGGAVDAVLSRIADIFFSIPLLLGAIVVGSVVPLSPNSPLWRCVIQIVLVLVLFGWPNTFRLMRGSVMQVKPNEYVQAARALGANPFRVTTSHIVPNALTPLIVVSTIDLGSYIATEATLSFLGVGLPGTIVSWGRDISAASGIGYIRNAPHMLLFPAAALCLTVLAFIILGEVVRDALDPKLR